MQSDVLSREQARQQRLADEIMNQTLQTIGGVRTRGRGRARGRRQILPETNVQLARNNISRRSVVIFYVLIFFFFLETGSKILSIILDLVGSRLLVRS